MSEITQGRPPAGAQGFTPPLQGRKRKQNLAIRIGCLSLVGLFMVVSFFCTGAMGATYFFMRPDLFFFANVLAFATAVPYCLMLLWLDRNEPEPWYLILIALTWGAAVATVFSALFNDLFMTTAFAAIGDAYIADYLTASISAPIVEEGFKGVGVLLIFLFFKDEFDNVLDGIIYGALIGLGFATIENVIYYVDAGMAGGAGEMVKLTWIRGLLGGIGSHAAYTAITGCGLGLIRVLRRGAARWLLLPLFWGTAMFAHFMWNTFCGFFFFGDPTEWAIYFWRIPIAVMILELPFVALLGGVILFVWRHENKVILTYLKDEQEDILTDELRRGMVPARRRVLTGVGRFFRMGPFRWWHYRRLERDLIELAFLKWHLDKGAPDWSPDEDDDVLKMRQRVRVRWKRLGNRE